MKTQCSVSFIVPVYNVESYLNECIESILMQDLDNMEIILINDGSTDNSKSICEKYIQRYSFIRLIDKKNGGISSARNEGLLAARGKYVCFIDSDDFYKKKFAKQFFELCEINNLDIIRGWYGIYEEERRKFLDHVQSKLSYINKPCLGQEFLILSIKEHANEVVPWLGFFKREYLLKNNLSFPEGIAYEEDQLFFLKALIGDATCRIMQSDIEFYAYRKRIGSATKTPTYKQTQDIIYIVKKETEFVIQCVKSSRLKKYCFKYITSSFYQLTSIYGRVSREDKEKVAKTVPWSVKWRCLCYPYDKHQWIKIFLFTFARWVVDIVYSGRLKR